MVLILAFLLFGVAQGKIYDRCELARELKFVHNAADHQLATWVCIAEHESQYNTSIVGHQNGDGSGDHGIFQISDKFWCSPPGKGFACGVTCAELEDDNISDDFLCAQRIYKEHKQLSGDGFNAWAVYRPHCKGSKAEKYIKDCFDGAEAPKAVSTPPSGFAHGFFDTAAGRANQGSFISAEEPAFEPFLNFGSLSFTQTTENPNLNSLLSSKSTFFGNLFTSTLDPNGDLFFTPPSTTTFRPFISQTSTYTPSTTRSQTRNLGIFNPTVSTTTTIAPNSRPSIFQFGNTQRTTTATPPTLGRSSAFQFGNSIRTTANVPQVIGSRSSIFQFGNTPKTTAGVPQTFGNGFSNSQFGNTLRTTATVPQTTGSRSSSFQFGNTLRTTASVPQTIGSSSSGFQFRNTFSSRSDNIFPSSTPSYQTSTVSQAAPVFIINGVKWN